ncbi:MAG: DNA polymerase III subunit beta [Clostridia bacterium]
MKFLCQTATLLGGLSIASRVLSARTTQPILEGVLIRTTASGLQITCSDGLISVVTTVPATISEEGDVVMPGKLFLDVCRKMPPDMLSFSVNDNFVATLSCQCVRMTLSGQSGSLYPALPLVSAENSLMLPQSMLRDMIVETSFAIALDDVRKVLCGALLEIKRGEARMVALDGFRLAMRLARVSEDAPELRAIIPSKTVNEIARILEGGKDELATVMIGGAQMVVNLGETQLYSTLIEGEFIDYRRILPADWATRVRFDRDQLAMCVERAALIAREGKNNLLKMDIEEGRMVITSNSESGDAYDVIDVEMEGAPMSIAFNVLYVSDILRALPEGEAYMRFNTPVSPCVVCPVEGDAYLYLMLPVRITA